MAPPNCYPNIPESRSAQLTKRFRDRYSSKSLKGFTNPFLWKRQSSHPPPWDCLATPAISQSLAMVRFYPTHPRGAEKSVTAKEVCSCSTPLPTPRPSGAGFLPRTMVLRIYRISAGRSQQKHQAQSLHLSQIRRGSHAWHSVYNQRTAVERVNNRILTDYLFWGS